MCRGDPRGLPATPNTAYHALSIAVRGPNRKRKESL